MPATQHKRQAPHPVSFSQRITTLSIISPKPAFHLSDVLSSACICMPLIAPGVSTVTGLSVRSRHITSSIACNMSLGIGARIFVTCCRSGRPAHPLATARKKLIRHERTPVFGFGLHIRYSEVRRAENWDDWPSRASGIDTLSNPNSNSNPPARAALTSTPTHTKQAVTLGRRPHMHAAWLTWNTKKKRQTTKENPRFHDIYLSVLMQMDNFRIRLRHDSANGEMTGHQQYSYRG